jgi:hypothetical protein
MNASDFLYEKYGIAVTEHNKLPVAIKPIDLLKYMEEYAALRQPPVSGEVCDNCGNGKPSICDKCYEIESNFREGY